MGIRFTSNPSHTVGVEMELAIIDPTSCELVSAASDLLAELGVGHPGGEHPRVKHELFECTIEIITGVCRNAPEAVADLRATLAEVRAVAEGRGFRLVSAGTHPLSLSRCQVVSPSDRYAALIHEMQWAARRLLIFGTHVHVGVASGPKAVAVVNEMLRYLPLLLALSASSPYFEGEDTGMASSRAKIFEMLPTAGVPPVIASWSDFERFMDTLLAAGCIQSVRDVWWDVRPHPDFGTVELRMFDAVPTVREVGALAALGQSLVAWIDTRHEAGTLEPRPSEWTVRENKWLAARHGLDARLLVDDTGRRREARALLVELVDELMPVAERLGSAAELADVRWIVERGAGYERARRVIEGGGTVADVVASLAHELDADAETAP